MKAHAKASTGHKSKAEHKFSHMVIKPAENGFMAEHHFERPKSTAAMPYPDSPEPETHVMSTAEEMGNHVSTHFGGKAAGVGKPGKSAPKNSKPSAESDGEPDADDED